jgi:hypothetical protein
MFGWRPGTSPHPLFLNPVGVIAFCPFGKNYSGKRDCSNRRITGAAFTKKTPDEEILLSSGAF